MEKHNKIALIGEPTPGVESKIIETFMLSEGKKIVWGTQKPKTSIPNKVYIKQKDFQSVQGLTTQTGTSFEDSSIKNIEGHRVEQILNSKSPIIFIGGETGCGKSYTIFQALAKVKGIKVYFEHQIKEFLEDKNHYDKYLYLDDRAVQPLVSC